MSRVDIAAGGISFPGAGAALRVHWLIGYTDAGNVGTAKFGAQDVGGFSMTSYGGGTFAPAVTAGAAGISFPSVGAALGYGVNWNKRIGWFTERTGPVTADWSCWSFRATIAFTAPTGAVGGDVGLVLWCGNQTSMNGTGADTNAGVRFGPSNVGEVRLQARQANAGALTVNTAVAASLTPDLTKFNTYEIRVVSGSNASDPVLSCLINGVKVISNVSWTAAAGLLPPPNAVAGQVGYISTLVNRSATVVANMVTSEYVITAAQSEEFLT